ncbi:LacI family DNA-binding transcriptional regulator [Jeongeupia naejangsanensis]|uniref:LacI family DNA-binding transcriptional regulator n=1 Tax=Jeongeupia naejangsanensis TaxID=613195 RepID=A0ABS2BN37_9NEIS|nr:LacI family DNA-binding transcriptional regulator [Jeongeupia naejangsanensis]MBM3117026.1 LacI family DNA-binding transcriptional regulator [Jeongeupia naejangsanensis]
MSQDPAPDRKPTISDVAALAGVSRAVASRALSSEPRPVAAGKRQRVLEAAQQLGFTPNLLARSLTTRSVNLVAIIVNHIHDLSDLDLFDLLLSEIQTLGKQVILLRVGSVDRVEDFLRSGIAWHVDAVLVFSDFADAATVRRMFDTGMTLMLNGRGDAQSPAVLADEASGIAEAVAHAAARGVRDVVLVTGRATSSVEAVRIDCYRAAFAQHGLRLLQTLQGDYSYDSGHAAGSSLFDAGEPDAVFCTSDAMAMGILDVHRASFTDGRPTRFRLYGFDDLSLTHFDAYPVASIGYAKRDYVREILKILADPGCFSPGMPPVRVPTRFVPRSSAG